MIKDMLDATPDAALEAALTECAREPIRVPGAIQPHGVLLSVAGDPLCIEQVSANCATELGMAADELLGKPLSWLLASEQSALVDHAYSHPAAPNLDPIKLTIGTAHYSASLQRTDDVLIIELEPFVETGHGQSRIITRVLRNLQAATTLETLFDISVHEIQALTGYDRVMIYRFEPEGHGKVVAQALTGPLPSYSGLNFPGSDIPAQARELYRLNWIRVIPDATYVPVPLIPTLRPTTGGTARPGLLDAAQCVSGALRIPQEHGRALVDEHIAAGWRRALGPGCLRSPRTVAGLQRAARCLRDDRSVTVGENFCHCRD